MEHHEQCRLFVAAAAGSGGGKSTICLNLLHLLLQNHSPEELAYIKPATQGIQQTLVAKYCHSKGISCRHVGPLVFFRGFTQKFLEEELDPADFGSTQKEYTQRLHEKISQSVEAISVGKKVVLIDGVGYPGVGSIVNCSNAVIARLCKATVLIVGKGGLGDCVDSYTMAREYFKTEQVPVCGLIVNRVPSTLLQKTLNVLKWAKSNGENVYGIIEECPDAFLPDDEHYSQSGEHNACQITFRAPTAEKLIVDALNEKETKSVNRLCEFFQLSFSKYTTFEDVNDSAHLLEVLLERSTVRI